MSWIMTALYFDFEKLTADQKYFAFVSWLNSKTNNKHVFIFGKKVKSSQQAV